MKTPFGLVLVPLLLAGCAGGAQPIDLQKLFSSMTDSHHNQADPSAQDSAPTLDTAENYRRAGDFPRALQAYDTLLQKDPDSLDAREGKALTLLAAGDFNTPGAMVSSILKEDLTRWKSLNAMGVLFMARSMQPEAQQYFAEALKNKPGHPAILNNMGLSQSLAGQFDAALSSLTQAAALAGNTPQRRRIDLNTALVYARAGKLDEANAIAGTYYSGADLTKSQQLYANLAKDDQLAKTYLNMAVNIAPESMLPLLPPLPVAAAEPVPEPVVAAPAMPEPVVAAPPPPPPEPAMAPVEPPAEPTPGAPPAWAIKRYTSPSEEQETPPTPAEEDDPLGRLIDSTPAYSGDGQSTQL